jgi:hypothetical protein
MTDADIEEFYDAFELPSGTTRKSQRRWRATLTGTVTQKRSSVHQRVRGIGASPMCRTT